MSKEDDDDARLYSCFKKYEEIVKQVLIFDELTDSMDPTSRSSKRKKKSKGNNNGGDGSVIDSESINEVIVQTITKFLSDLNAKPSSHK